jgi:hypothetical protein
MDIQVIRAHSLQVLDLAFQCHHDWFAEAGYITPNSTRRYTDSFTSRSVYFLALSNQQAVGMVRVVERAPFRTLTEFEIEAKYRSYDFVSVVLAFKLGLTCAASFIPRVVPIRAVERQTHPDL